MDGGILSFCCCKALSNFPRQLIGAFVKKKIMDGLGQVGAVYFDLLSSAAHNQKLDCK